MGIHMKILILSVFVGLIYVCDTLWFFHYICHLFSQNVDIVSGSVNDYLEEGLFWTRVYRGGPIYSPFSICWSGHPFLCLWSVFKYLGDCPLVFSNFLHEVRAPYGPKSDKTRFLKKNLEGSQMGENPHIWGIFDVFCPYLCIHSLRFSAISNI